MTWQTWQQDISENESQQIRHFEARGLFRSIIFWFPQACAAPLRPGPWRCSCHCTRRVAKRRSCPSPGMTSPVAQCGCVISRWCRATWKFMLKSRVNHTTRIDRRCMFSGTLLPWLKDGYVAEARALIDYHMLVSGHSTISADQQANSWPP